MVVRFKCRLKFNSSACRGKQRLTVRAGCLHVQHRHINFEILGAPYSFASQGEGNSACKSEHVVKAVLLELMCCCPTRGLAEMTKFVR